MAANNSLDDKTIQGHTQAQIKSALRTPYIYRPLNDFNEEIRVVNIHKVNALDNIIECDIEHCLLSEAKDAYEAVSYVWGDQSQNHQILCDGGKSHLQVKPSLHEILWRIASLPEDSSHHHRYWIDGICINQDDAVERGKQVQKMRDIYYNAQRVHIFLGTVEPDKYPISNWFTRRWVLQEHLNANRTSIHLKKHDTWYCHDSWESFQPEVYKLPDGQPAMCRVDDARFHILTMMFGFRDKQCRDDRDRLFALIGGSCDVVTKDTAQPFPMTHKSMIYYKPDYTATTEQAYLEFAQAALASNSAFNLLSSAAAFRYRGCQTPRTLPSWVPDWRCELIYFPTIDGDGWFDIEPFTAGPLHITNGTSLKHMPSVVVNKDGRSITLKAIPFGTIERISEREQFYGLDFTINIDNGYLALAPGSVTIGDHVIIPIGAPTPLVLRRDESANYTLISNCWVVEDPTRIVPPAQDWIMNADCGSKPIRDYRIV